MKRRKAAVSKELLLFFVLAVANRIVASLIYKQYRNVEIRRTKNEKTYSRAYCGGNSVGTLRFLVTYATKLDSLS